MSGQKKPQVIPCARLACFPNFQLPAPNFFPSLGVLGVLAVPSTAKNKNVKFFQTNPFTLFTGVLTKFLRARPGRISCKFGSFFKCEKL